MNNLRVRTPKSMNEALNNGLTDAGITASPEQVITIRSHVQDFVGQKFTAAIVGMGKITDLYRTLFEKDEF